MGTLLKELWEIIREKLFFFRNAYAMAIRDFIMAPNKVVDTVEAEPKQNTYLGPGAHLLWTITLTLALAYAANEWLADVALPTRGNPNKMVPQEVIDWIQWARSLKLIPFIILYCMDIAIAIETFIFIKAKSVKNALIFVLYLNSIALFISSTLQFILFLIGHIKHWDASITISLNDKLFFLIFYGFTGVYYARFFKDQGFRKGVLNNRKRVKFILLWFSYLVFTVIVQLVMYGLLMNYLGVGFSYYENMASENMAH